MTHSGQGKKRVDLHGRVFFVKLDDNGSPHSIAERKERAGAVYNNSYWHRTQAIPQSGRKWRLGGPSIVATVLRKAGASVSGVSDGVDNRQIAD